MQVICPPYFLHFYRMNIYIRALLHLLFWVLYFSVNLFNEIYLSASFSTHLTTESFLLSLQAQLLILAVKIPAVYYVLYRFIPGWQRREHKTKRIVELLIVFAFFLLCYRGVVHFVLWPYIYHSPAIEFTFLQLTARFLYSLLDLLQVTGIAVAIKLFRLRIEAVKREKSMIHEKLQSEILHLKSQINPHFLFNTLNSIYALALTDSLATQKAVLQLSKLLRYMLYETGKSTTTLDAELKIIDEFVEIQKLRFGKKINYVSQTCIDNPTASIAPLLLLPLVENAFKHGTENIIETIEISFNILLEKEMLVLQVTNPVSKGDPGNETEGIGLSNINRQLQLLYRDYSLTHKETGNHYVVELKINLESYEGHELLDRRG